MQKAEYNYIKQIFPFIFYSKFNVKKFNEQPFIKDVKVTVILNVQNKPEILFWYLFFINNKKSFLQFSYKKKYNEGKSVFTKSFLNISKKFGSKKNIIFYLSSLFYSVLQNTREISLTGIFPYRQQKNIRVLKFYDVRFDERFNGLINLAPKSWINYNLQFLFKPSFNNGLHFRFFLQNLQLPVL